MKHREELLRVPVCGAENRVIDDPDALFCPFCQSGCTDFFAGGGGGGDDTLDSDDADGAISPPPPPHRARPWALLQRLLAWAVGRAT